MIKSTVKNIKNKTKSSLKAANLPQYFQANKSAWDRVAPLHKEANHGHFLQAVEKNNFSALNQHQKNALMKIGVKDKNVCQPGCNNGVELISIKKMGAAECVGFDISPKFIQQAIELTKKSQIDCQFIRENFFNISRKYYHQFNIVFVSVGTLPWMLDLDLFTKKAHQLLKKGGHIMINEMNPLLHAFNYNSTIENIQVDRSYFMSETHIHNVSLDYYQQQEYEIPDQYSKYHSLSEIFNTLIKNNFVISSVTEHQDDISLSFPGLAKSDKKLPLSYTLIARRN